MDLTAQHFLNNEIFYGMALSTVFAWPGIAKNYLTIVSPTSPAGNNTGPSLASPNGLAANFDRPYFTVTVSMNETESLTSTVRDFEKNISTEWTTITKEKTLWRTKTTTETIAPPTTTTILKPTTTTITYVVTDYITFTKYSKTLKLFTPKYITSWLPKATITRTEWKKLPITEYVTLQPAIETANSESSPNAPGFSLGSVPSWFATILLAFLVLTSVAAYRIYTQLKHHSSRMWHLECIAQMSNAVAKSVQAGQERDAALAARNRAVEDHKSQDKQSKKDRKDIETKSAALQRIRDTVVSFDRIETMQVTDIEDEYLFSLVVEEWKVLRAAAEDKIRITSHGAGSIEAYEKVADNANIVMELRNRNQQLENQIRELRAEMDPDGSYVNELLTNRTITAEINQTLVAKVQELKAKIHELKTRLAKSGDDGKIAEHGI